MQKGSDVLNILANMKIVLLLKWISNLLSEIKEINWINQVELRGTLNMVCSRFPSVQNLFVLTVEDPKALTTKALSRLSFYIVSNVIKHLLDNNYFEEGNDKSMWVIKLCEKGK